MTFDTAGGMGDRMWAFEQKLAKASIPHRALIEFTHRCNFRCVHCYESNHQRTDELTTAQWQLVIDRLKDGGVLYLTFSGGEFLLRPDHRELARHARSRGLIARFFTNASLVTDDVVAFWKEEIQPAEIEVSLYGASPETYERVTGTRKGYRQAVEGLARLAAAGFKTHVKIIALAENLTDVPAMVALVQSYPAFTHRVTGKLTPRDDGSAEPLRHRIADSAWEAYYAEYESVRFAAPLDGDAHPCNAGRTGLVVGPNADVYACVDMRNHPVGNLVATALSAFWQSDPFLEELRAVKNSDFVYPDGVDYTRVRPPCMAHNLHATGTLTQVGQVVECSRA
jgi:MoaA/NifB/PqqE/SkfB family radical SAM enzyme